MKIDDCEVEKFYHNLSLFVATDPIHKFSLKWTEKNWFVYDVKKKVLTWKNIAGTAAVIIRMILVRNYCFLEGWKTSAVN